jgi:hypothetical protein
MVKKSKAQTGKQVGNKGKSKVIMVPVKRHDVNLTFDDLLAPLTKTAKSLSKTRAVAGAEVAPLLLKLNNLLSQLNKVVAQIERIDPSLMASKPGPSPSSKK